MLNINKTKHKKLKKKINNKEQVLVIAQEIKFARLLSGNEKKSRDRVLKTLKKWLTNCFQKDYQFKEEDFARVWKGLFYAVWMSDKPLTQEELCDDIAALLDEFPEQQMKGSILMFKAALRILGTEWYGIDQHRMDKFLMLVRRLLRGVFRVLDKCEWSKQACTELTHALTENEGLFSIPTPSYARNSLSLLLHITECYLEELAKVSKGALPEDSLVVLVTPFMLQLAHSKEIRLAVASRKLFNYLVRQSETGQEYETRRRIWSQMGCPEGGPNALVPASDDEAESASDAEDGEDESTSSALDPRAGHVDVVLPTLPVPSEKLAQLLKEYLKTTSGSAHRRVKILCQRFIELSKNKYPLQVEDDVMDPSNPELKLPKPARAAKKLDTLEKQLLEQSDELDLKGISKKQRKRLLAKTREGVNIVEELAKMKALATNGAWRVEDTETPKSKKRKSENMENMNGEKIKEGKIENKNMNGEKTKGRKTENKENMNGEKIKEGKIENKNMNGEKTKGRKTENKENMNGEKTKKRKSLESKELIAKKQKMKINMKEESIKNSKITDKKTKDCLVRNSKDTDNEIGDSNKSNTPIDKVNICTNEKVKKVSLTVEKRAHEKVKMNKVPVEKSIQAENQKDKNKSTPKLNGVSRVMNSERGSKKPQAPKGPSLLVNKVKRFQKPLSKNEAKSEKTFTGKKVKFALKNNSMQGPVDYYKSVRNSPSIPYDSARRPAKTNLKPNSTPSPINPFIKRKLRIKS
ncbi:Ribosomal RNA processing protein 1 homolog [Eumeta japonica]|uniref:Ribosomal RNA processing protein 1 homolog n=1 Tax=Eumeta variegata TaxID=151549 RepID=A0A4C1YV66_EUMVA|nr:Ribosomal RNA processing protein 1 homolog [Eumeta japonica]